jgi:hypothetical protein
MIGHFRMKMSKILALLGLAFFVNACGESVKAPDIALAIRLSDSIIAHLDDTSVANAFPKPYFDRKEVIQMLLDIQRQCSLATGRGNRGRIQRVDMGGGVIEYHIVYHAVYDCGRIRYITAVRLEDAGPKLTMFAAQSDAADSATLRR